MVLSRVVFVGGSRGTSPSLDLTFPPTGLSKKLRGNGKGKGRERGKGRVGIPPALLPHWLLPQIPPWFYLVSFVRYSMSKNVVTLKSRLKITQGH